MIKLVVFALVLAFLIGLFAGVVRAVRHLVRGASETLPRRGNLGLVLPMILIWLAIALISFDSPETGFQLFWRATLAYAVAWVLVGERTQRAVENVAMRRSRKSTR